MSGLASMTQGAPRSARAVMASRDPQADDVDFFPTPPWAARAGGELIKRLDPGVRSVWEPACGAGHMVHGLKDCFDVVHGSDLCLYDGNVVHDFLGAAPPPFSADWIVTNPPFCALEPFIRRAWGRAGRGVAMLMRGAVLEGQARYRLLHQDLPLTVFAPFSERVPMTKARYDAEVTTASFYAWFLWLKPVLRPARMMARVDGALRPAVLPIAPGQRAALTRASDMVFACTDANGVRGAADE